MAARFIVERRISVDASTARIWRHVKDMRGWSQWSPWTERDPDIELAWTGVDGEIGSSCHWRGNRRVGEGHMTISNARPTEEIVVDLRLVRPFTAHNEMTVNIAAGESGSTVTWSMTGPLTIMSRIMSLFGKGMDQMVGPDFDRGLANLKHLAETD